MPFKALSVVYLALTLIGSVALGNALPPNDLHLRKGVGRSSMTEAEFNTAIDIVTAHYEQIVKGFKVKLAVVKSWSDDTVNAYASQSFGTWKVEVMGGLARHPKINADGLTSVVCHELGHHLAGFPFYQFQAMASEGQADYFAAFVCTRELWKNDIQKNATFRGKVDGYAKEECDRAWRATADQDLCYRIAAAALPLAELTAEAYKSKMPKFTEKDTSEVTETFLRHPEGQCRLDTAIAATGCDARFSSTVIPGKKHPKGQESLDAEEEAAKYSCLRAADYTKGLRSRCWFKPRI